MKNQNSHQMFCKSQKVRTMYFSSTEDRNSFFQESIDNNKSIEVTKYKFQIQAIIKKRKTFEVFKLIYFKKPTIKKFLLKLRVLSDASVFIKYCFYKQA